MPGVLWVKSSNIRKEITIQTDDPYRWFGIFATRGFQKWDLIQERISVSISFSNFQPPLLKHPATGGISSAPFFVFVWRLIFRRNFLRLFLNLLLLDRIFKKSLLLWSKSVEGWTTHLPKIFVKLGSFPRPNARHMGSFFRPQEKKWREIFWNRQEGFPVPSFLSISCFPPYMVWAACKHCKPVTLNQGHFGFEKLLLCKVVFLKLYLQCKKCRLPLLWKIIDLNWEHRFWGEKFLYWSEKTAISFALNQRHLFSPLLGSSKSEARSQKS